AGQALYYEGSVEDITERRRMEDALRESEERFRSIFENATIGLYRTTPDGRILMANQALLRMLGYSSFDALAQRNLEEKGYEPGYPRSAFKQRIKSEGQVIGLESAWVRRNGTTLFIRESARAVRDEAGNTLYYEGTVEDITERKRAEEALQKAHDELEIRVQERTAELAQANKALRAEITERKRAEKYRLRTERLAAMGRLAAALAHEINNPLQAISNSLELALDFPLEERERQQYLQAARGEIQRLIALTNHMLYFARPTRVERQPITVAKAVHDALVLASRQLDHSHIRVSLDLPDVLPPVLASSSQLAQVFLNLMINAIEAMPDGGELSIVVRLAGDQVEVTFADSGPGIPPHAITRLFEPFYTTKENGTGLGLATSHSIILQHGGTITAGNAPGGGAVFTIALPIAPLDKPHLAERK
ncbi:MAG: PAS domain S-box protein, partial [Chloroflexi bacterium]|nr:PAS domain S-box protein [Chloroflexota bacterium]